MYEYPSQKINSTTFFKDYICKQISTELLTNYIFCLSLHICAMFVGVFHAMKGFFTQYFMYVMSLSWDEISLLYANELHTVLYESRCEGRIYRAL